MLSTSFRVNKKVQVLDAVTSILNTAVILSLISHWCLKTKWSVRPERAIFNVPEDGKENAATWNLGKFHEHNDTCVISRRLNSRKEKLSFNPRWLHRDSMVCFKRAGSFKKGIVIIKDRFVSQCTVHLVNKPQDVAGNGPTFSRSLYVKYSNFLKHVIR